MQLYHFFGTGISKILFEINKEKYKVNRIVMRQTFEQITGMNYFKVFLKEIAFLENLKLMDTKLGFFSNL